MVARLNLEKIFQYKLGPSAPNAVVFGDNYLFLWIMIMGYLISDSNEIRVSCAWLENRKILLSLGMDRQNYARTILTLPASPPSVVLHG